MIVFARVAATLFALAGAVVFGTPNLANAQSTPNLANAPSPCTACGVRGAPAPIAGAGLPLLAVGYGVYWLIKRRRKAE
jgi:hypothetical protein